jgi:hypothetical protein
VRQAPHHFRQLPGLDVAAGELAGQRQCEKYSTLDEAIDIAAPTAHAAESRLANRNGVRPPF